jgi:hypothetical protein
MMTGAPNQRKHQSKRYHRLNEKHDASAGLAGETVRFGGTASNFAALVT